MTKQTLDDLQDNREKRVNMLHAQLQQAREAAQAAESRVVKVALGKLLKARNGAHRPASEARSEPTRSRLVQDLMLETRKLKREEMKLRFELHSLMNGDRRGR